MSAIVAAERYRRRLLLRLLLVACCIGLFSVQPAVAALPTGGAALRLRVTTAGLQQISAAALFAAGLPRDVEPQRLQLWLNEQEQPLELLSSTLQLQPTDRLRFFAATVGDRWNRDSVFRLSWDGDAGRRITTRAAMPADAQLPAAAVIESGSFRQPTRYLSTLAGPSGDHWFSAELIGGAGSAAAQLVVPLQAQLPAAASLLTLTIRGSSARDGEHRLLAAAGTQSQQLQWAGVGDWQQQLVLPSDADTVTLTLQSAAEFAGLLIDRIDWQRPAQLQARPGVQFSTPAAAQQYLFTSTPAAGLLLYDISDATAVQRLSGWQNGFSDDGPRRYLLSSAAQAAVPQVERQPALSWPSGADAIFIAPPALQPALEPLLVRRRAEGLQVAVIDPQAIYDGWSGGHVDPIAIRRFLQAAAQAWQPVPTMLVLVGDGSVDPHNYSGRNDRGLIPPYMADVDPWLGETACENCFVLLDGDDPRDDDLPELAVSRLPVKDAAQLRAVVAKLLAYEDQPDLDWRATQLYLSDNAFSAAGAADPAGNFFAQNDALIARQPAGVRIQRNYFDPRGSDQPGYTAQAAGARRAAIAALQAGVGVLVYSGHASQWQYAVTDPAAADGYLLGLYDADTLQNGARLPVVLALTCLSSAFQTPAYSGTTIDERLVLAAGGGAAAVWGSAGMGVLHGQLQLANGFFTRLWDATLPPPRLGELTLAGYQALIADAGCCRDQLHSAVLLGDATMPLRLSTANWLYLPSVGR